MSNLTQLVKTVRHRSKRLGRGLGSGKGAKSTRGTTRHQKSKVNIPLHFEGGQARLVKKYPLLRGRGKNNSHRPQTFSLSLSLLNVFPASATVDREALAKKGLIPTLPAIVPVKILLKGKLEKKLTIKLLVSAAARAAIEKAGGSVISA